MLRFEGGKASANALKTAAIAIKSDSSQERDSSTLGQKRSLTNEPENGPKKVKRKAPNVGQISNPIGKVINLNVVFECPLDQPFNDNTIKPAVSEMAQSFAIDFSARKAMQYKWGKMSILWSQECIIEYESAVPRYGKEHKDVLAFWAIAYGCKESHIYAATTSIHYPNSASVSVAMEITLKATCPEDIAFSLLKYAFQPPPAPLHYTLEQFYQHLQPTVSPDLATQYVSPELRPQLLPFQSQNVEWMLKREGHQVSEDGVVVPVAPNYSATEAYLWEKLDMKDQELYINRASEQVSVEVSEELQYARSIMNTGGILSDEMGLGKTVSMLALILLHKRKKDHNEWENGLLQSGATLIITPSTISHQWEAEIKLHAPTLSYTYYQGAKDRKDKDTTPKKLASYDIVLTNYEASVLSREIWYARDPNERSRRTAPKYPPRRSPLVQVQWWRCLLDEAQMVESTVAATAEMARIIPRHYSWAVTGTPMSSGYSDLYGLFLFLGIVPSCATPSAFTSLYQNPDLFYHFLDLTARLMRRNAKENVKDQVVIPIQRRKMAHVSFSQFEQHYYDDLWAQCCRSTNLEWLDSTNWGENDNLTSAELDQINQMKSELRIWLITLRQTCVHPGVGIRNQRQLGSTVHTLPEVLEVMINQAKDRIKDAESNYSATCLRHAGMHEILEEWQQALSLYLEGVKFCEKKVEEARKEVEDAKALTAGDRRSAENGKTSEVEVKNADLEKTQHILSIARNRLSNWLLMLHRFLFYAAGMYHELKDEENETRLYERAEEIRREHLQQSEIKFKSIAKEILAGFKGVLKDKALEFQLSPHNAGLLSWHILEDIANVADKLDAQMELIIDWRGKVYQYLTMSLENEEEAKGDEYETSLVVQETGIIYLDWYQMLLKDHEFYLNGTWNYLYLSDTASKPNKEADDNTMTEELKKLGEDLKAQRKQVAAKSPTEHNMRSLQTILRDVGQRSYISDNEQTIADLVLKHIRKETDRHRTILEHLDNEARKFSQLYNSRIEYYRVLQHISDQVKVWESKDPTKEIEELKEQKQKHFREIAAQAARSRYLINLNEEEAKSENDNAQREFDNCLICSTAFDRGIITYCGHMFCEDCANHWFQSSRRCPSCNATVAKKQWWTIAWNKPEAPTTAVKQIEYSGDAEELLPASTLSKIQSIHITGGLGAKLDTIIKHIKYIIQTTEDGKCVVFSQWKTVLDILSGGLKRNNIGYVEFGRAKSQQQNVLQFRSDPSISVILLNARTQSSGLTLVAAQTVFMVEPVFNEALEQQAISRVDRIGQTKETTVYWYIIRDTIEERVHEIHNAKRHYRNRLSSKNQNSNRFSEEHDADSLPLHATLDKLSAGGGEVVSDEDLRRCFTNNTSLVDDSLMASTLKRNESE